MAIGTVWFAGPFDYKSEMAFVEFLEQGKDERSTVIDGQGVFTLNHPCFFLPDGAEYEVSTSLVRGKPNSRRCHVRPKGKETPTVEVVVSTWSKRLAKGKRPLD